jgi:hypothetical protein
MGTLHRHQGVIARSGTAAIGRTVVAMIALVECGSAIMHGRRRC